MSLCVLVKPLASHCIWYEVFFLRIMVSMEWNVGRNNRETYYFCFAIAKDKMKYGMSIYNNAIEWGMSDGYVGCRFFLLFSTAAFV